jgi:leucyl/phenylalanyl-tRNA--protein transferase
LYFITKQLFFPPADEAGADGLLGVGGDLSPERLMLAYRSGIFPWFADDEPILWWSPDPRMVLFPAEVVITRSMKKVLRNGKFRVTFNQNFRDVIVNCRNVPRSGQVGTWITEEMVEAYLRLHELGHAKSVEVWQGDELVGGLYGVDLGHIFCGESMFSKVANASKIAFITLAAKLQLENYRLLDCQVHNDHLESLGAREIPRRDFMKILKLGKTV